MHTLNHIFRLTRQTARKHRRKGLAAGLLVLVLPLSAQVPGSALDMMLQRPKVAKHYEHKRFGDHFFLEGGVGLNSIVTRTNYLESPSFSANIGLGDWVTPLHGWRIDLQGGSFKLNDRKATTYGGALNYMLNITALSQPTWRDSTYANQKAFEVIGVAGVDFYRASQDGESANALGLHLGLRGQARLSDYTYFYIEPRLGVYSDNVLLEDSWRGYRFAASLMAGFGYRVSPSTRAARQSVPYLTSGHFLDDTFVSVSGGPSALVKNDGSTKDYFGGKVSGYLGKWFNPYIGVRLGAHAGYYKQAGNTHVKALGLSAGVLWNMRNTFMGYNPDRRFWINAVADASLNGSGSGDGKKFTPGIGGGLQFNVRLGKGVDFYLEPRVDVYGKDFAYYTASSASYDAAASLMAGLTFHQNLDTRTQLRRNDDFKQQTAYDNLFFEAGAGGALPVSKRAYGNAFSYLRPKVFVGVGKWFTATDGLRLWVEASQYQTSVNNRIKTTAVGVDYLWNITNAFHGYIPDRPFELVGAIGVNGSTRHGSRRFFPGLNAGLKGIWHANKMWALFIEPQLRLYNEDYLHDAKTPWMKPDLVSAVVAGLQVNLRSYNPVQGRELFDDTERKSFFSVAGGLYAPGNSLRTGKTYGAVARMSYGRWFSPLAAWRVNLSGQVNPRRSQRYAQLTLGGDYLLDLSALSYGYDEDRVVTLRALAGLNLGVDYTSRKSHFVADVHGGAQLGFRLSKTLELYLEPQVGYRLDHRFTQRMRRVVPQMLMGLNYRLRNPEKSAALDAPSGNRFASVAIGTGIHSTSIASMTPGRRKLTLDFDLTYGQWFTTASGWRVGLSDVTVQRHGPGNQHITALHADYLRNLLSSTGQSKAEAAGFRLTGIAGVTANLGTRKGYSPTYGLGLEAGFQAGWMVSRQMEIFVEPMCLITSKTIIRHNSHPAEVQARFMLGTTYHF